MSSSVETGFSTSRGERREQFSVKFIYSAGGIVSLGGVGGVHRVQRGVGEGSSREVDESGVVRNESTEPNEDGMGEDT